VQTCSGARVSPSTILSGKTTSALTAWCFRAFKTYYVHRAYIGRKLFTCVTYIWAHLPPSLAVLFPRSVSPSSCSLPYLAVRLLSGGRSSDHLCRTAMPNMAAALRGQNKHLGLSASPLTVASGMAGIVAPGASIACYLLQRRSVNKLPLQPGAASFSAFLWARCARAIAPLLVAFCMAPHTSGFSALPPAWPPPLSLTPVLRGLLAGGRERRGAGCHFCTYGSTCVWLRAGRMV